MCKLSSSLNVHSGNINDTFVIGKIIGENLLAGDILALTGELGAGKTSLTQGLARGLGVSEHYQITSPTFTLINEYNGRCKLYHLDLYRLMEFQDMEDICYEEYLNGEGVCVIEWAEKIHNVFSEATIFISLTYIDDNSRKIVISGDDGRIIQLSKALECGGFNG